MNHSIAAFGIPPLGIDTVRSSVGNGARALIERSLGAKASKATVEKALEAFLAHYEDECVRATRLYAGVETALAELEGRRPLAVLTNKPLRHTRKILEQTGIARRFVRVAGGDSFPTKKPDPRGLLEILNGLRVPARRACLVGDSAVDVETARAAGASAAVVTYGFQPEPALALGPEHVLHGLADLLGPIPA